MAINNAIMKALIRIISILLISVSMMGQGNVVPAEAREIIDDLKPYDPMSLPASAKELQGLIKKDGFYTPELNVEFLVKLDSIHLSGVDSLTGELYNGYSISYEYDSENRLSADVISVWNEELNQWMGYFRNEYSYDQSGKVIEVITYEMSELTSMWMQSFRVTNSWGPHGVVTTTEYEWDPIMRVYWPMMKTEYEYNFAGFEMVSTEFQWERSTESWVNLARFESVYDPHSRNLIQYKANYWDERRATWYLVWVLGYEYQLDRLSALLFIEVFGDVWFTAAKYNYTYDEQGDLILYTYSEWNDVLKDFEYIWRENYSYDMDKAVTRRVMARRQQSSGQWLMEGKSEFNYNKSYHIDDILLPFELFTFDVEESVEFKYMLTDTDEFEWDSLGNDWSLAAKSNYYYSDLSTSIKDPVFHPLSFYPNPTSGQVFILMDEMSFEDATIGIFDMHGKCVFERPFSVGSEVNVSDLPEGMYQIRLKANDKIYAASLIKQ